MIAAFSPQAVYCMTASLRAQEAKSALTAAPESSFERWDPNGQPQDQTRASKR